MQKNIYVFNRSVRLQKVCRRSPGATPTLNTRSVS